jgi:hypothetical protein
MSRSREVIPGVIKPLGNYQGWKKGHEKKTIEDKRQAVIRGIERSLRGEKGAPRLERFDRVQAAPVIRVLYASHPLPIFDGEPSAVIDPECDRGRLWGAILEEIRAGAYDAEIEDVARKIPRGLERKGAALKAASGF